MMRNGASQDAGRRTQSFKYPPPPADDDSDDEDTRARLIRQEKMFTGQRIIQKRNALWAEHSAERRAELTSGDCDMTSAMPYGGILSCGITLASTTIGSGILGMPAAFHASGMVMAVLYLLVFGGLTILSYTLLGLAAMRTGYRNYGEIVHALMGKPASIFCGISLVCDAFAALLAYVSSIRSIFEVFFIHANENFAYFQTPSGQQFLTSMLWLAVMLPLGMPRAITSLKYSSLFAVALMGVFVLFVVIRSCTCGLSKKKMDELVYFQHGDLAISGLTTFIFSFSSQVNSYILMKELYEPSVWRFTQCAILCVGIAFTMYFFVGVFGYMEFGPAAANGSALTLYDPSQDSMMMAGYIFITFKLCVSYGLFLIGCSRALYYIFGLDLDIIDDRVRVVLVGACGTLSLILGLFVPQVSMVLGIVGGCFGGFNAYIFPALLAMYTGEWTVKSVGILHYLGAFFVLIAGVVAVVFSTVSVVYDEFVPV